ncbi:hypothetical protein [Streptomyces sp. NPDC005989]|uniref:hypothetical protein n=1 Tax=Streptomyces sp. NPDC005989 TaxID=3156727 RepID=UPI0033F50B56
MWGAVIAARVSWDLVWASSWCSVPASVRARRVQGGRGMTHDQLADALAKDS